MAQSPSEPFPFPTAESHELPQHAEKPVTQEPTDMAIDSGVEESFPASDPVSVTVSKVITPKCEPGADAASTSPSPPSS